MKKYYCITCGAGQKIKEELISETQAGVFGHCACCGELREVMSPQEYSDEMIAKEERQRIRLESL